MIVRVFIGIAVKVELGKASDFEKTLSFEPGMDADKLVVLRPQRFLINAVSPGFAYLDRMEIDGFDLLCNSMIDTWAFNANAVGNLLDFKKATRESKLLVRGRYTGLVPAPLGNEKEFELTISTAGPAATKDATPEELKQYGLD
jgi:hypothetical protein